MVQKQNAFRVGFDRVGERDFNFEFGSECNESEERRRHSQLRAPLMQSNTNHWYFLELKTNGKNPKISVF